MGAAESLCFFCAGIALACVTSLLYSLLRALDDWRDEVEHMKDRESGRGG